MRFQPRPYLTFTKAKAAFPNSVTAAEMMNLVKSQYGIDLHPTNIGNIGKRHGRTITFWKGPHMDRHTGYLYDPKDVPFFAWMLYLLEVSRTRMDVRVSNPAIEALDEIFAGEIGGVHQHHVVPKHAGGTDDPDNLISLTLYQHAIAHKHLYEEYKRYPDFWAWRRLLAMCLKREF